MEFYRGAAHHKLACSQWRKISIFRVWFIRSGLDVCFTIRCFTLFTPYPETENFNIWLCASRESFPFDVVNLFPHNCIVSLLKKKRSNFRFYRPWICRQPYPIPSQVFLFYTEGSFLLLGRNCPVPLITFATPHLTLLISFSPMLALRCTGPGCGPLSLNDVFIFSPLEFLTPCCPLPQLLSTELALTDHLHSQQYQIIFFRAIALPEVTITSLLLGMCIALCALLCVYHQWFHLPSSQSCIITRSLHNTYLVLLLFS